MQEIEQWGFNPGRKVEHKSAGRQSENTQNSQASDFQGLGVPAVFLSAQLRVRTGHVWKEGGFLDLSMCCSNPTASQEILAL
jgi:hypothetical protein